MMVREEKVVESPRDTWVSYSWSLSSLSCYAVQIVFREAKVDILGKDCF